MQIGGVGSGDVHTANSHQVTDCVHGHQREHKTTGAMNALPYSAQQSSGEQTNGMQQNTLTDGMSTMERVKKLFAMGRRLIGRIWNGPEQAASEILQVGQKKQVPDGRHEWKAGIRERMEAVNPQAAPSEAKTGANVLWQRFKLKVYTATGHLAKRFGKNALLQTDVKGEQGRRREEARGKDGSRKGRKDIEAVPADRSYLMDSYDKTGRYVKLGQENGRKHN